jgi:uncharacterized protein with FMN-binding domain
MRNVSPSDPRPPKMVPRRGLAALALTATGMALLFSFKTPSEMLTGGSGALSMALDTTAAADASLTSLPPGTASTTSSQPTAAAEPPTAAPVTEPPTTAPVTQPSVLTGQVVRTPYGPVQVEVTIDGASISEVQALQLPYDRSLSRRISQVVEPMLHDEALQAQSARIHLISGATYTSKGYAMSLQSALDQALG